MRSETDGNQEEEGPELGLRKTESAVQCVTDPGGRGWWWRRHSRHEVRLLDCINPTPNAGLQGSMLTGSIFRGSPRSHEHRRGARGQQESTSVQAQGLGV